MLENTKLNEWEDFLKSILLKNNEQKINLEEPNWVGNYQIAVPDLGYTKLWIPSPTIAMIRVIASYLEKIRTHVDESQEKVIGSINKTIDLLKTDSIPDKQQIKNIQTTMEHVKELIAPQTTDPKTQEHSPKINHASPPVTNNKPESDSWVGGHFCYFLPYPKQDMRSNSASTHLEDPSPPIKIDSPKISTPPRHSNRQRPLTNNSELNETTNNLFLTAHILSSALISWHTMFIDETIKKELTKLQTYFNDSQTPTLQDETNIPESEQGQETGNSTNSAYNTENTHSDKHPTNTYAPWGLLGKMIGRITSFDNLMPIPQSPPLKFP